MQTGFELDLDILGATFGEEVPINVVIKRVFRTLQVLQLLMLGKHLDTITLFLRTFVARFTFHLFFDGRVTAFRHQSKSEVTIPFWQWFEEAKGKIESFACFARVETL